MRGKNLSSGQSKLEQEKQNHVSDSPLTALKSSFLIDFILKLSMCKCAHCFHSFLDQKHASSHVFVIARSIFAHCIFSASSIGC